MPEINFIKKMLVSSIFIMTLGIGFAQSNKPSSISLTALSVDEVKNRDFVSIPNVGLVFTYGSSRFLLFDNLVNFQTFADSIDFNVLKNNGLILDNFYISTPTGKEEVKLFVFDLSTNKYNLQ